MSLSTPSGFNGSAKALLQMWYLKLPGFSQCEDRSSTGFLRSWIQECQNEENALYSECNSMSHHSRYDCYTRDIVKLQTNQEYLALSYILGKQHITDPMAARAEQTLECVPVLAPATIEDAMQVVNRIGQRCLWIDRYCIQKTENKHIQIQNMGLIYEGAIATTAAVAATESEFRTMRCLVRKKASTLGRNRCRHACVHP